MPNLSLIPATSLKKQRLTTDQTALSHLKVGSNAHIACVASVSNRVIARKLERKQKKGWKCFFCSCPSFLDEPREEKLATQANAHKIILHKIEQNRQMVNSGH